MSLRHLSNDVGADGVTPPGFQFPVKELVASLSYRGGLHKPTFFSIMELTIFIVCLSQLP